MSVPRRVRIYILAVTAVAALSAAAWSWAWPDGTGLEPYGDAGWLLPITFGLLCTAAVLFPLHLDRGRKLVINDAVLFSSLLLFGAPLAIAVVALGTAAGYLILMARGKRNVWDTLANSSKNAIAVAAGGVVYYATGPAHAPAAFDNMRLIGVLPLTAAAVYVFNTLPSSLGYSIQHHKSPLRVWLSGRRVDALQSVALYLLGLVTALTVQEHPWAVLVMALPAVPIYVTLKRSVDLLDRIQDNHTVTAVEAMADTVDLRNPYTHDHSRRVAERAVLIARALLLPEQEIEQIRLAARVHDLGNIGVSDQVLRKPGPLTDDEWEQVEKHVRTGYDILGGFPEYRECREIVLLHHERWDGSGYPQANRGITSADSYRVQLAGQVVGIADALDAMTSERPYRAAMLLDQALDTLRGEKGRQWEPRVAEAVEAVYATAEAAGVTARGAVRAAQPA